MTRKRLLLASGTVDTELLANNAVTLPKIESSVATTIVEGGGPKITSVDIANSTYHVLDDTAANIGGGYIVVNGTGFKTGAQLLIEGTPATSVTFIDSNTLHAQVPAKSAATYNLYVVNTDGGTAINVNGLTYSSEPLWITGTTLTNQRLDVAFNLNLNATYATTYQLALGSSLPNGVTLLSNGYVYGTVTGIANDTLYNFDVVATDAENQESTRSFSLTVTTLSTWIRKISTASYDTYAENLTVDDSDNVYVAIATKGSGLGGNGSSNNTGVLSLTKEGSTRWQKQINTESSRNQYLGYSLNYANNAIYYTGSLGSNTSSVYDDMDTSVFKLNANTGAVLFASKLAYYHSTYGSQGDEGMVVVHNGAAEDCVNVFDLVNGRTLFGGTTQRSMVPIHYKLNAANGSLNIATYARHYSNNYECSTAYGDKHWIFDAASYKDGYIAICGKSYNAYDPNQNNFKGFLVRLYGAYPTPASPFLLANGSNPAVSFGVSNLNNFKWNKIHVDASKYTYASGHDPVNGHAYLIKITPTWSSASTYKFTDSAGAISDVGGVCTDSDGNIYISMQRNADVIIVKLNSSFVIQWQRKYSTTSVDVPMSMASTSTGQHIYSLVKHEATPKYVTVHKLNPDGSDTGTWSGISYANYTTVSVSSQSLTFEYRHHSWAPSGGSQHLSGLTNTTGDSTMTITTIT
jgi:hypothetical protein